MLSVSVNATNNLTNVQTRAETIPAIGEAILYNPASTAISNWIVVTSTGGAANLTQLDDVTVIRGEDLQIVDLAVGTGGLSTLTNIGTLVGTFVLFGLYLGLSFFVLGFVFRIFTIAPRRMLRIFNSTSNFDRFFLLWLSFKAASKELPRPDLSFRSARRNRDDEDDPVDDDDFDSGFETDTRRQERMEAQEDRRREQQVQNEIEELEREDKDFSSRNNR